MKTILEVTPSSKILYTIPEDVFMMVLSGLQTNRYVAGVISTFPTELRDTITVETFPNRPNSVDGRKINLVFVDELIEL